MEDLIALRVQRTDGKTYAVLTYGRIFDAVDPKLLIKSYLSSLSKGARDRVSSVEMCSSLAEVSGCAYFYEGLFTFAIRGIPFGSQHADWIVRKRREFLDGNGDFYLVGDIPTSVDRDHRDH